MTEDQPKDGTITLSTGVVLKLKPVNALLVETIFKQNMPPVPKPPRVFIESKGREEENPDDPGYVAAQEEYQMETFRLMQDVVAGLGTEIAHLPKGFDGPDGTTWSEQLTAVGLKVAESGFKRYISWVRFWACRTMQDNANLVLEIRSLVGTPEEAVAEAAESFRNRAERRADSRRSDKASG